MRWDSQRRYLQGPLRARNGPCRYSDFSFSTRTQCHLESFLLHLFYINANSRAFRKKFGVTIKRPRRKRSRWSFPLASNNQGEHGYKRSNVAQVYDEAQCPVSWGVSSVCPSGINEGQGENGNERLYVLCYRCYEWQKDSCKEQMFEGCALRFANIAPQSCKRYGYLSSKVE